VLFAGASISLANVKTGPLFADGAVLQQGMKTPVWGTADPGEQVTVSIDGKQAAATADANGHWIVRLPELTAGGPFEMTVSGKDKVVVHNVAVGEVWIASGQSNMDFPLRTYKPADPVYGSKAHAFIATVNDPLLSFFVVSKKTAYQGPLPNDANPQGGWRETNPKNADIFSAVAYHFAQDLRKNLNVPVGIIQSAWGATFAQAWTSKEGLESNPELKKILDGRDRSIAAYPEAQKKYETEVIPAWKKACETAKAQGKPEPKPPRGPLSPGDKMVPSTLFNAMINPVIPYGIKGVIWYQGEADAGNPGQYRVLFPALIKDWRAHWGQGDFPFLFVQLANIGKPQQNPVEGGWAGQRESQLTTLSVPKTGMACAIDLADSDNPGDIHPHNKEEVARRLSLIAFSEVYGKPVPSYSGPLYSSVQFSGCAARLTFTHVDGGLVAKGEKLTGFAIAGRDSKFVWSNARIGANTVEVSSPEVPQPVAVRYDWAGNPIGNLYNKNGLPAVPFRTDIDVPLTQPKR
jgi:sialate O-acetylesterase